MRDFSPGPVWSPDFSTTLLYTELIRSRTFKANAQNPILWNAVGETTIALDPDQPPNSALNVSLKLDAPVSTVVPDGFEIKSQEIISE